MRYCKSYAFPENIKGFRLGWSLAGPPLMSVYVYAMGNILMDTGQAHMGPEALNIARENGIQRIYLTHHHEDHSGNAALIFRETGAEVYGHELARKKLAAPYKILPYQKYVWGAASPVDVRPLSPGIDTCLGPMVPVHTPGHSRDHTAYFLPDRGILFAGDLYLGDRIKFFRADEDLGAEVASLKKVAALDFDVLLCCHNPRREGGKAHILAKLDFLENFYGSVKELHTQGYGEKQIFSMLRLKEDRFTRMFCFGNVSMINGVRSVIRHYEAQGRIREEQRAAVD
ncbi:MAG: MBL fold metallo-hydrolase [Desulfobacter sp.]|nr:MAG: MBL fold metallo-hydrolase [Desulfobacter sp.]